MSVLRQFCRVQTICPRSRSCSSSMSSLIGRKPLQSDDISSNTWKRYQSNLYQTPDKSGGSTYRDLGMPGLGSTINSEGPAATAREDHQKHDNPGQDHNKHQNQEEGGAASDFASEDEQRFKDDLLELALSHVKTVGWSTEAISRAATEAGLSPAVGSMFKDVDLVHYFISKNNEGLENHLKNTKPVPNLRQALEWRLRKVVPYVSSYSEAIALISRPEHVTKSVGLLMDIADTIAHHSLKDSSTDLNWYSKRIGIAGIFVATELCLIQDKSEGYSETWKFLERRCQEFDKYGKGEISLSSVPALPDLLHVGFTTIMNIIGRNARR